MPSVRVHKIASVVHRLALNRNRIELTETLACESGNVVVVRAMGEKRVYNDLELENGRMAKVFRGDVIVGALGSRRALQGFVGEVPDTLRVGDALQLLNMGGVLGRSTTQHKDLGQPTSVEVLGMAVKDGRILNVRDASLPPASASNRKAAVPIVLVSGTCMNSGKTFACAQAIHTLSQAGLRVHAGKLSGVACRRDAIAMEDHGAVKTATFLEAGYPSTAQLDRDEMVSLTHAIIAHLEEGDPDLIFLELGDGIIGDYGVMAVLEDPAVARAVRAHLFCAGDMVGAWGGQRFLADRGITIDIVSGPATDTPVGVEFVENELKLPAINARLSPEILGEKIRQLWKQREDHGIDG